MVAPQKIKINEPFSFAFVITCETSRKPWRWLGFCSKSVGRKVRILPRPHASRYGCGVCKDFSAYSIPPHGQFAILSTTRRLVFGLWVRFPPFSALLHGGGNMLVLSRKLGEKIYIGDQICITVVDIDRGKIRLGIEAPRDVAIYRQELLPGKDTLITETVIETPVSSRRD